jgi:hypothetical protein
MRINCKFLKNVDGFNAFQYADQWFVQEGVAQKLYFQVIDLDRDGLRYLPPADTTVTVKFADASDLGADIEKTATMTYADDDRSIFELTLDADEVPASGNARFEMDEGGDDSVEHKWLKRGALKVDFLNQGSC